ncbi:Sll8025 protein [[Actinomadura] parvosata subsp. kistnae]|uniref:DUF2269 domain-containing protein n=1 Tax=[Actinomadura] parvosata subsp. kistnae TaxID=1909395 RepID=A0A1U9ZZ48_9ACTN|nr:hypothetical protein [Nonomuraea sp. ATCC 55076]AQZ63236.1 hypothetical protein BKM31_18805 [Nonomuraea sp. ATCC 55076]SPL98916.1 Sll8025 protein [Actinomadura parvosata subsp. kistnae]
MARSGTTPWRHLLAALHVLTSVGWMAFALALVVLLSHATRTGDPAGYRMADLLDDDILLHFANASAFTGLMLSGMTRWGYTRYWWILAKLLMTLGQLYAGIFLLGTRLDALAAGSREPATALVAGTGLMASALAVQTWLAVAKPWKRTPWARAAAPEVPAWMLAAAVAVPVADYLTATLVFGHPAPLLTVLTMIGYPIWRAARAGGRRPARA